MTYPKGTPRPRVISHTEATHISHGPIIPLPITPLPIQRPGFWQSVRAFFRGLV